MKPFRPLPAGFLPSSSRSEPPKRDPRHVGATVVAWKLRRCSAVTADASDEELEIKDSIIKGPIASSGPPPLKSCLAGRDGRESDPEAKGTVRSVRFDTVEFREYFVVLCDNPSTTFGPPVGLGWEYDRENVHHAKVESYETNREVADARRCKDGLRIPPKVRLGMVLDAGHSPQEVQRALARVEEENQRRTASLRSHRRWGCMRKITDVVA